MASEKKKETRSWQQSLMLYIHDIMCMLLVVMLLFLVVFRVILVTGDSMFSTLWDGDYLLLLSETFCDAPEQGDIVVISKQSFDDGKPIVKRVIATEGQTVDIDFDSGMVYVDGVPPDGGGKLYFCAGRQPGRISGQPLSPDRSDRPAGGAGKSNSSDDSRDTSRSAASGLQPHWRCQLREVVYGF